MLAFNMKVTDKAHLTKILTQHVDKDKWPAGVSFVQELEGWRERMRDANYKANGAEECRDIMLSYYKLATQASFHFQSMNLATNKISFRWHDTFSPSVSISQSDWQYERACTLFNVAAAISYMATCQDRGDLVGIKTACYFFQQAAGTVAKMREVCKGASWLERTPDMMMEFLEALESLMLAQAQKCFFEKAVGDGMKDVLIAKIAAECAALYEDTAVRLSTPRLKEACAKDWIEVVEWNRKLFDGMQHYYASVAHAERKEFGQQVSRLAHATNMCAEAVILCQKASPVLQEQFKRAHKMAKEAWSKAKNDNDLVYNDKVPPVQTLPKVERKAIVRPLALTELEVPNPVIKPPPAVADPPPAVAVPTPTPSPPSDSMAELSVTSSNAMPPPPSFAEAEEAAIAELVSMGFAMEAARAALHKANGSVEQATEYLLSGA
mmetsp:Transcript_42395/g.70499  ORF Transcript_42395/g.70499 Transcript_42395/m.70499 type:complete len:437 (+) Transcript_42395:68-1378(+)